MEKKALEWILYIRIAKPRMNSSKSARSKWKNRKISHLIEYTHPRYRAKRKLQRARASLLLNREMKTGGEKHREAAIKFCSLHPRLHGGCYIYIYCRDIAISSCFSLALLILSRSFAREQILSPEDRYFLIWLVRNAITARFFLALPLSLSRCLFHFDAAPGEKLIWRAAYIFFF